MPALQRGARRLARALGAPLRGLRWLEDRTGPVFRLTNRHRGVVLLAAVSIATAASAVHFVRYPELRQQRADEAALAREQEINDPAITSELPGEDVARVGPPTGGALPEYVDERRGALADLPADAVRLAVVSFEEYRSVSEIMEVLPAEVTVLSAQYRLPGPVAQQQPLETEVVDGDLEASMERVVEAALADIDREATDVASTLETEGLSEDFAADYRSRLEQLRVMQNVLRSEAAILFAVVVEGPVDALRAVAGEDSVRLVDPAPDGAEAGTAVTFGLLPEDEDEATHGVPS